MTTGVEADVDVREWRDRVAAMIAQGFDYPDYLTGVDRLDRLEVVVHLRRSDDGAVALLRTSVPADHPELDCLCDVLPGLAWHERETAEMFGMSFIGGVDHPPLLTDGTRTPLRKVSPLAARIEKPWPGAEGARRVRVPGVNDLWREDA